MILLWIMTYQLARIISLHIRACVRSIHVFLNGPLPRLRQELKYLSYLPHYIIFWFLLFVAYPSGHGVAPEYHVMCDT